MSDKVKKFAELAKQAGLASVDALVNEAKNNPRLREWAAGKLGADGNQLLSAMVGDAPDAGSDSDNGPTPAVGSADIDAAAKRHLRDDAVLQAAFNDLRIATAICGGADRFQAVKRALAMPDSVFEAWKHNK